MRKQRVLVTGAAGGVARLLLPGLTDAYELVLTDRVGNGDIVEGDLTEEGFVAGITAGVDAVVHLAANADPRATFDELRGPNIDVPARILASSAPRVVLASSAHVMGQYVGRADVPVDPDWPPAPCCAYGATKAFAEALGRASAHRSHRSVVALRLGATTAEPPATSALAAWLGPEDLQQLVIRALEASVRFAVCPGISANTRTEWDLRNDIGYVPVLDSEPYAGDVPPDPSWGACQGADS